MTTDQTDAIRLIQSGLDKLGLSPAQSMASGECAPPVP